MATTLSQKLTIFMVFSRNIFSQPGGSGSSGAEVFVMFKAMYAAEEDPIAISARIDTIHTEASRVSINSMCNVVVVPS